MAHDDTPTDFPRVDPLPQISGGSTTAPWTGRRMYASGLPGGRRSKSDAVASVHEGADETERGGVGVAQTAVWNSFLHRIIKKG